MGNEFNELIPFVVIIVVILASSFKRQKKQGTTVDNNREERVPTVPTAPRQSPWTPSQQPQPTGKQPWQSPWIPSQQPQPTREQPWQSPWTPSQQPQVQPRQSSKIPEQFIPESQSTEGQHSVVIPPLPTPDIDAYDEPHPDVPESHDWRRAIIAHEILKTKF